MRMHINGRCSGRGLGARAAVAHAESACGTGHMRRAGRCGGCVTGAIFTPEQAEGGSVQDVVESLRAAVLPGPGSVDDVGGGARGGGRLGVWMSMGSGAWLSMGSGAWFRFGRSARMVRIWQTSRCRVRKDRAGCGCGWVRLGAWVGAGGHRWVPRGG